MSLFVIHAGAAATLASDDPVIPAAELSALRSATDALAEAGRLRTEAETATRAATAAGHEDGRAAGHAEGLAAAAEEVRAHLLDVAAKAAAERLSQRSEVSRLALEVVRRIAGDLGEGATVAGLAGRAAADLLPDAIATVRVRPDAAEATTARLHDYPGLAVIADAALPANECLIETSLGISHAGLDIQLAAIERTWAAAAEARDAR